MSCNGKRYNIFPARTLNKSSVAREKKYKNKEKKEYEIY